ncbi:hypothetical protein J7384_12505 [Endozoicomonas sp. G2_1]|uniref:hypothetical protein n=1 Tax=Endozoicomonas sp. G2_1 TaxID=2821091 RepID=UPI001ADD25F4|nr:hypothetical protein [Endozoicomonas sp. G2_1]MBO9491185.1 hypothetical protein [Endozoicomonas sp. G2_1]
MKIDYTKYSLEELFDVAQHIDAEQFPERKAQLDAEILRRQNSEEWREFEQASESDDDYWEQDSDDFVIEFNSEQKSLRWSFIGVIAVVIMFLSYKAFRIYQIPSLNELHQYQSYIENARCLTTIEIDEETDKQYYHYDLKLVSFEQSFFAINLPERQCKTLAKKLNRFQLVNIWHQEGLIYQLEDKKQKTLLNYEIMSVRIKNWRVSEALPYTFFILVVLGFFGKSIANAAMPGTFVRDD